MFPPFHSFVAFVNSGGQADAYYDYAACCDSDTDAPSGSEGGSSAASEADAEEGEVEGLLAAQSMEIVEAKLGGA